MRIFVLNLKRRTDRKERFISLNDGKLPEYTWHEGVDGQEMTHDKLLSMGFDTDKDWVDSEGRYYSSKGSQMATVSHMTLWEKCVELNEPIFVLEDDARILPSFNIQEIYDLLDANYNLIYPGYAEQKSASTIKKGKYQIPVYPYWTSSYVITPVAAKVFLEYKKKVIATDELITILLKDPRIIPIGRIENSIDQGEGCRTIHNKLCDSDVDILQSSRGVYDTFIDFKVHLISDNIIEAIHSLPEHDVILYTGENTIVADCINQIMYRFISYNTRVLVCADRKNRTNLHELFRTKDTKDMFTSKRNTNMNSAYKTYKYINPNIWIGRVSELKKMYYKNSITDPYLFFDIKYLTGKYDITIDRECKVFQCADTEVRVNTTQWGKELYNPITQTQPCIYHDENKKQLQRIKNEL